MKNLICDMCSFNENSNKKLLLEGKETILCNNCIEEALRRGLTVEKVN